MIFHGPENAGSSLRNRATLPSCPITTRTGNGGATTYRRAKKNKPTSNACTSITSLFRLYDDTHSCNGDPREIRPISGTVGANLETVLSLHQGRCTYNI